ncbi:MAG: DUF3800 domain-containing protein [Bifidobacteriaceae bacterium]|jgi:hypothetical protein|nr:DUF3800 domain-containing protein [Bifidobacteriaceae bacterium]
MAARQLVFLDDAADPGFRFERASSRHFVIACVVFDDTGAAERVAAAVKEFRRARGWSDAHELKFNKLEKTILKELLAVVAHHDYRLHATRVDKLLIEDPRLRGDTGTFYNFVISQALDRIPGLDEADVRIDGRAGRRARQSAGAYFRQRLNSQTRKIDRLRFVDSKTNVLIQLADLVAGSVYRQVQDKTDAADYVRIIQPRVHEIWDFEQERSPHLS